MPIGPAEGTSPVRINPNVSRVYRTEEDNSKNSSRKTTNGNDTNHPNNPGIKSTYPKTPESVNSMGQLWPGGHMPYKTAKSTVTTAVNTSINAVGQYRFRSLRLNNLRTDELHILIKVKSFL